MFFQCGNISKQIPLKNILFHGLIRDEFNRKMSKSLNNGIDPMKVIDEYGADALRFFLVSTVTVGEDLRYSNEKIKYR
jgi:valyl-tRNA synthetase